MNKRTVGLQMIIFSAQWLLMIFGFGLLVAVLAPARLVPSYVAYDRYLDSTVKAGAALGMSVFWLYVWDRQVRRLVYKEKH